MMCSEAEENIEETTTTTTNDDEVNIPTSSSSLCFLNNDYSCDKNNYERSNVDINNNNNENDDNYNNDGNNNNNCNITNKRRRRRHHRCSHNRERSTNDVLKKHDVVITFNDIQNFCYKQQHSLRISASNIAAITGYNPYTNIPEVMYELIYQGRIGQALLLNDVKILGLKLISDDERLQELANKANINIDNIIQIKHGKKIVNNINDANTIKSTIISNAEKKLSKNEFKIFQNNVKHVIDTTYGTVHENYALDLYEKQIGWTVEERNTEIRSWSFQKDGKYTVTPITKVAIPLYYNTKMKNQDIDEEDDDDIIDLTNDDDDVIQNNDFNENNDKNNDNKEREMTIQQQQQQNNNNNNDENNNNNTNATTTLSTDNNNDDDDNNNNCNKPYFHILGSIDGIREELAPNNNNYNENNNDDNDSWIIRKVIVECKHRMNHIHNIPPLYEQIQTITYCFMYGVEEADIVQVLRLPSKKSKSQEQSQVKSSSQKMSQELSSSKINSKRQRKERRYNKNDESDGRNQKSIKDWVMTKEKTVEEKESHSLNKKERPSSLSNNNNKKEKNSKIISDENESTTNLNSDSTEESDYNEYNKKSQKQQNNQDDGIQKRKNYNDNKVETNNNENNNNNNIIISINRISINDTIMQHEKNWYECILPRIRSFVDAVYNIRQNDYKRLQLLLSISNNDNNNNNNTSSEEQAWRILFNECPWLESCDTAYQKMKRDNIRES